MSLGAVGGTSAPQLQTSWTRAEAACAARQRGDVYFELTHPQPPAQPTAEAGSDQPLTPGFTLHL